MGRNIALGPSNPLVSPMVKTHPRLLALLALTLMACGGDLPTAPGADLTHDAGPVDTFVPATSIDPTFVLIEPGSFKMGSDANDADPLEQPAHPIQITQAFFLQTTEVTQALYEDVMGTNLALFGGCPTCPVERVKWHEAIAFCNALSDKEGLENCYAISGEDGSDVRFTGLKCLGYRLPTEAEWEYAARAGSTSPWTCGEASDCVEQSAWVKANSASKPHEVGGLPPNAWGLYDMMGNVFEWVWDWHMPDYYAESVLSDPTGPETGNHHAYRGGSWSSEARACRSSDRSINLPKPSEGNPCGSQFCWPEGDDGAAWHYHSPDLGFRVARSAEGELADGL